MLARLIACACCWLAVVPCAAITICGQEQREADAWAEKYGLVRLGERWWVLPAEMELREKLAELPRRRERIVTAEKELESTIAGNLRTWQESRPAIAALEQTLAKLATGDPQRLPIERQMAGLAAAAVDPVKLGGRPDVRRRLAELAAERCELLAAAAWIRDTVPGLKTMYAKLATQPEVAAALQRGEKQRLGPQRGYRADLTRLVEFEPLAATRWVPIFQQSGQPRLTALVNDRTPVTFTWSDETDQPVVLTASAAEAAGLSVPADAPREEIPVGSKRTVVARQVTLDDVRLGRCVLRGVPAYVLPPEAEDVGNRLGRRALLEHRVRLEPTKLRMWIDE
jgi:hypothetical protein